MQTHPLLRGPHAAAAALLAMPLPIAPDARPRAVLAAEIDRLIQILDLLDADPDLEDTGDDEPSLGAYCPGDLYDGELDNSDDEWSLGSPELNIGSTWDVDQSHWAGDGPQGDYEADSSDCEHSMASWENPMAPKVDGRGRLIVERVPDRRVRRPKRHASRDGAVTRDDRVPV